MKNFRLVKQRKIESPVWGKGVERIWLHASGNILTEQSYSTAHMWGNTSTPLSYYVNEFEKHPKKGSR